MQYHIEIPYNVIEASLICRILSLHLIYVISDMAALFPYSVYLSDKLNFIVLKKKVNKNAFLYAFVSSGRKITFSIISLMIYFNTGLVLAHEMVQPLCLE